MKKILSKILKLVGLKLMIVNHLPIGMSLIHDINKRLSIEVKSIFDIGANVGQTYLKYRKYWKSAKIWCFEPVPETFEKLTEIANNDTNCMCEMLGFGEVVEEIEISIFEEDLSVLNSLKKSVMNGENNAKRTLVKVSTVDEYVKSKDINHIDLLKIDVEGWELQVLSGTQNFLSQGAVKIILVECGFQKLNIRNTNFNEIVVFFEKYNYYFYSLYDTDDHDFRRGNQFSNALFVRRDLIEFKN